MTGTGAGTGFTYTPWTWELVARAQTALVAYPNGLTWDSLAKQMSRPGRSIGANRARQIVGRLRRDLGLDIRVEDGQVRHEMTSPPSPPRR